MSSKGDIKRLLKTSGYKAARKAAKKSANKKLVAYVKRKSVKLGLKPRTKSGGWRDLGSYMLKRGARMAANYVDPTGTLAGFVPAYADGGQVERTGLALVHRGEFVTNAAAPHPWKSSVINPFASPAARIPDDTSFSTFVVTQSTNTLIQVPQVLAQHGAYISGMRLRPSMSDGSALPSLAQGAITADSINPCVAWSSNADAAPNYQWQCADVYPSTGPSTGVLPTNYVWGLATSKSSGSAGAQVLSHVANNANQFVTLPANQTLKPIVGPMGYALQQGSKCRPTAWGIRIRYAGLQNTVTNINPYGRVYFGIHLPMDEGNLPGQGELDTFPCYDGVLSTTGVTTPGSGPGNSIRFDQLQFDHIRGRVGCLTLEELKTKPDGIVIATGPRTTSERLFTDVNYASGQDRVVSVNDAGIATVTQYNTDGNFPDGTGVSTASYTNVLATIPGSQPWFIIEGGQNVNFVVDTVIHWEVVPNSAAYTLPGTCKVEFANSAQMDAASNAMGQVQQSPGLMLVSSTP